MAEQHTDVLILGGGLSGLHTAFELQKRGVDSLLVEARQRLGGRILSRRLEASTDGASRQVGFDLGPAWFWPGQHRMEGLIRELGLEDEVLDQFGAGDAIYEDPAGGLRQGLFGAAMLGSYRLRGGMGQLIDRLAEGFPEERLRLGWRGTEIHHSDDGLLIRCATDDGEQIVRSRQVVIAMPPRLVERTLRLEPSPSPELLRRLRSTPTWMAGQGKCVVLYDRPFWRDRGLSGDVISHRGPLGEIHDVSPFDDHDGATGPGALFGFFAIPPVHRKVSRDALRQACVTQLGRVLGEEAARPREVFLKDWAFDDRTATEDDRETMAAHSEVEFRLPEDDPWSERLVWSGSETASAAQRNNGYLEGALEASLRTLGRLEQPGRSTAVRGDAPA